MIYRPDRHPISATLKQHAPNGEHLPAGTNQESQKMGNLASAATEVTTTEETTTPPAGEVTNDAGTGTATDGTANAAPEATEDEQPEVDKEVRKLRDESAARRTRLREAEAKLEQSNQKYQDLLQKLGALSGDEQPEATAEDLLAAAEKRSAEAEQRVRDLLEENAVRAAAEGVAKSTILPFLRGSNALNALDQAAEDYAGQVKALIEKTVNDHPEFANKRVVSSSGNAGTPTPDVSSKALTRADLQRMSSEEIVQADREGRLDHLKKN